MKADDRAKLVEEFKRGDEHAAEDCSPSASDGRRSRNKAALRKMAYDAIKWFPRSVPLRG